MRKNEVFTLVELAIVIVIIGLLVGGVLQGQELIKQAKIRNLAVQLKSYDAAIILFKDKYQCLPGDCPTATIQRFFGSEYAGGNGNLIITTGGGASESAKFWQHLGLAKLIKGTYSGTISTSLIPWRDVPGCNFEGCGISVRSATNFTGGAIFQNFFEIGKVREGTSITSHALLETETAQSIDAKIDDGVANSGLLLGVNADDSTGCSAIYTSNGGADYQMNSQGIQCRLFLKSTYW